MKFKVIFCLSIILSITTFFVSCSPAFWEGVNQGLANSSNNRTSSKLMLFGGKNNQIYLGCLNCNKYSDDSIFNQYGNYGSKYSTTSIWNNYGDFGSRYSEYSPWNKHANNPPVIVDEKGDFYGYFTINKYFPQRTTIPSIKNLLDANSN